MVKINNALVFSCDADKSDEIITKIQQQFDVHLIFVTTSYGPLWIKKGCETNE